MFVDKVRPLKLKEMAQKGPFSSTDFDSFLDLKFWTSEILFLMSQTLKYTALGLVKAIGERIRH